jgi:hypothetical protein
MGLFLRESALISPEMSSDCFLMPSSLFSVPSVVRHGNLRARLRQLLTNPAEIAEKLRFITGQP